MGSADFKVRLSFQWKVLVPVLAALVLLPAVTLWIVNRYISRQMQDESMQSLLTAQSVFHQSLELRSRDLLARFRIAANESSYRSLAPLVAVKEDSARETVRKFLHDRLDDYGEDCEALMMSSAGVTGATVVRRRQEVGLDELLRATLAFQNLAEQNEPARGAMSIHGRPYLVASVPVTTQEATAPIGALTVIMRLGDSALQELKSITGADIILLDNQAVTAATIRQPELPAELLTGGTGDNSAALPVQIMGAHYLALAGTFEGAQSRNFRYVVLSSYESRRHELARTRTTLISVSLLGILLCGSVVWFLIQRITRPLLALRDHAEAVGGGDFTRRITSISDDECGAVAVALNEMTENLQASRAELEQAVGTLKTTQAQLIQSEKLSAVGQFVAGVAHELNNPLTSVIGFSELLQAGSTDPKQRDHLAHVVRNAHRCHKIVHSLLGFSRQHEPERRLVRLDEVADAVLEIVAYDMRVNNVTLVREYAPNVPALLGDPHQLQQVVLNIVSNARQALESFRKDGQITLRTGVTGDKVWLRIIDDGPGISPQNLKRIFDPFFTTKPQGKGTGLGLSLSYGIVQEHLGSIRASSQLGLGTEFILEFPRAQPAEAKSNLFRSESRPPLAPYNAPLRILAIDDEESILSLVREILGPEGHQVDVAGGGEEGLGLALERAYDVIISDWKMPGMNGAQVFETLRTRKPEAARRLLFMTGDVVEQGFQTFLQRHDRLCLPKPFSLREFHVAVAGILRSA